MAFWFLVRKKVLLLLVDQKEWVNAIRANPPVILVALASATNHMGVGYSRQAALKSCKVEVNRLLPKSLASFLYFK